MDGKQPKSMLVPMPGRDVESLARGLGVSRALFVDRHDVRIAIKPDNIRALVIVQSPEQETVCFENHFSYRIPQCPGAADAIDRCARNE